MGPINIMDMDRKFWDFVNDNLQTDPAKLRLKYHGADGEIDYEFAIVQIECRKKFAKKLSFTLAKYPEFLFPSVLAGEQCTSDALAQFHASLISEGSKAVDLTAGLGIDASHLASRASSVTAIEQDEAKTKCLKANFDFLDVRNEDCRDYVSRCEEGAFDVVFIDPARRAANGDRVFALSDCQPEVLEMMPDLERIAKRLIIKASPMLDITNTLRCLGRASKIISLGTPTECKELVAVIDFNSEPTDIDDAPIEAITIIDGEPNCGITFTRREESLAKTSFALPKSGEYLLEPYPATMKAAPYNLLSERFGIGKISANTQLYVSDGLPEGFPGEAYLVEEIIPYESKHIKRLKSRYPKILVTARNFDISADALRAKLGVKDGGDKRLFAFNAAQGQKLMAITSAQNAYRPR